MRLTRLRPPAAGTGLSSGRIGRVIVGVHGGGSIHAVSGFAAQDQVAAGVSGGGKIDLGAVEAENAATGVNGGGVIIVRARASLAAGVNGGGEVRYFGNPAVTSGIHGGGTVRPVQ